VSFATIELKSANPCAPQSRHWYFVDLREDLTYKSQPKIGREVVVTGKDFEEYVKNFLAESSNIV
jgi:hypothetical protein